MVSGADTCGLVGLFSPLFLSHGNGNKSEITDDQVAMGDQNELLMIFIHGIDDIATVLKLCIK